MGARPARGQGEGREAGRGREIRRLFRHDRAACEDAAHRILAMFRGEKEGVLDLNFEPEDPAQAPASGPSMYEQRIARKFNIADRGRPADKWLNDTVRWAWRTRVQGHLAVDLRMRLWQAAEDEAVRVFASNLRDLLLAAPAGHPRDPGPRSGLPHRREGRRGRCHRQGRGDDGDLPARAEEAMGRSRSPSSAGSARSTRSS